MATRQMGLNTLHRRQHRTEGFKHIMQAMATQNRVLKFKHVTVTQAMVTQNSGF